MKFTIKLLIFGLLLLMFTACEKENNLLQGVSVESNIVYGKNNGDLLLDIYSLEGDTAANRPVLILAHGGGGNKSEWQSVAPHFVRSGFVVASINYTAVDSEGSTEGVSGSHDVRAAIRYFRSKAEELSINPEAIFIGGVSQGAGVVLSLAYLSEDEVVALGDNELTNYLNNNGGIEGNSGNPNYSSEVQGVVSFAGGILQSDWIDAGEPTVIFIHGTADNIVPTGVDEDGYEGSSLMYQRAQEVGIASQYISLEGVDHDVLENCSNCWDAISEFLVNQIPR